MDLESGALFGRKYKGRGAILEIIYLRVVLEACASFMTRWSGFENTYRDEA